MLPSANRFIVANFFTSSYRIIGKVEVGNSGLLGVLSDPSNSQIQITDASLARLTEPKRLTERFNTIQLLKRGLVLIVLGQREDAGPDSVVHGTFGRLAKYSIRAITGDFEFQGTLEWTGRFELAVMLSEGRGDFFPLFDAKMRSVEHQELSLDTTTLIFNRRKLDLVGLLSDKTDA